MQENVVTNPPAEIRELTRRIVDKLSRMSPDEIIVLDDDRMMDAHGNIIAIFPAVRK